MNVMNKAWEIARQGANKFGGTVKSYFAEALRMAWEIVKRTAKEVTIKLSEGSKKHKTLVAEITGLDAKFGFARKFINGFESNEERGLFFELAEGKIYDANCGQTGRKYIMVKAGEVVELTQMEVKGAF